MSVKKVLIVKANGEKEFFDPLKLERSLLRSNATKPTVDKIVTHIENELADGMSTSQIYKHAFFLLGKCEKNVAVKYSLRRAILDLGPSGFPFEDFIGEIFKEKGYRVETGKVVKGFCVEHEMDVVAYNENKLLMVEAKFHNELGVKSDLKVALYIKARFEDLSKAKFFYGKERKLDEGWLITNTKFSTTAIQYGECQNLRMVGWNYPEKGNLQDMIEDSGLHPITCLVSINKTEEGILMRQGIVLCKTIKDNPNVLKSLGFKEDKIKSVIDEIVSLQLLSG